MKKIRWNRDWKFQNDIHKTQEVTVSLPHDAMQTEKRLEGMKNGAAAGFFPGGRYVYRKTLYGEEAFRDQAVYLEFEGIYSGFLSNASQADDMQAFIAAYPEALARTLERSGPQTTALLMDIRGLTGKFNGERSRPSGPPDADRL